MAPTLPRLWEHEQKEHEHNYVFPRYDGFRHVDRLQQLERLEQWASTASPLERFQVGLILGLVHLTFVLLLQSVLPPLPNCDPADFDFIIGACAPGPPAQEAAPPRDPSLVNAAFK